MVNTIYCMAVAFYFPVCLFQLHFAYPKPLKAEKLGKRT